MLIQNFYRLSSILRRVFNRALASMILALVGLGVAIIFSLLNPVIPPIQAAIPTASTNALAEGRTQFAAGRFAEAVMLWQSAVQSYVANGDRHNQALSLSYLSLAYQELNQWDEAQEAIDQSLNLLGHSAPDILLAQAFNTHAQLLSHTGQLEQALNVWEQAQKSYEAADDTTGAVGCQVNRAQVLRALGFYRRAKQLLESLNHQLVNLPDSDLKVNELRNLGSVLQSLGDLTGSRTALEASLAIAQRINAKTEIASTLLALGNTTTAMGDLEAALSYYQQAEQAAVNPLIQIQTKLNQISLYTNHATEIEQTRWYPVEALTFETYQQLMNLPPSRMSIYGSINLVANLSKLKDNRQPISAEKLGELLAFAVQSARDLKDSRAEAYGLSQWGQLYAQAQQWSEAQQLMQQSLTIAEQIQSKDITARASWQLGRILKAQGKRIEAIASYTEAVEALQSLRSDLVAIKSEVQFSFRESVEPVYRELVALLLDDHPSQEYLVQARGLVEALQLAELDNFFQEACLDVQAQQIDQIDPHASIIYPILLPDRLAVIVSIAGKPLHFHAIATAQVETEQTLRQLLGTINPVEDKRLRLQLSQKVYDWLIRPVETSFTETKTLVFVLDGLLRKIPLAALHDGEKYLIEKYAIALSPGLQLITERSRHPNFQAIVGGMSEAREGFTALPAVKAEIEQVSHLIPASTLLNQQFTSSALANLVQRSPANVVHLATHGQFSSTQENTFLLTWEGRLNVKELSELLRNRANRHAIDLLVLSACDTAAGDDRATLGLAGLAVKSGARATLATLWPVKDKAAALVMTQFYEYLRQPGMTKAEALQKAQIKVLTETDFTHPFFWSTFVLVGNWL